MTRRTPSRSSPAVAGFIGVVAVVPFLFVGFDVIPQSAEEINLPARKIGKIVVISVLMAIAFYIVIIWMTSLAIPASELTAHDLVTADALSAMFGSDVWGKIVIAGGLAGIITSWNAFLMGSSRLMWAMAVAGMIPAWFGKLHPKYRTPVNSIIFIGILSALAPFLGAAALGWIVDAGSPAIVIAYFLVSIAFIVLRKNEPDMARPPRIGGAGGGGMVIGVIAAVLTLVLFILYIPITPFSARLAWQSWAMFGPGSSSASSSCSASPVGSRPAPTPRRNSSPRSSPGPSGSESDGFRSVRRAWRVGRRGGGSAGRRGGRMRSRMTERAIRILDRATPALDRLNDRFPWSHNDHFHPWIRANLPARRRGAIDLGCGQGELLAQLAEEFRHVHGTDTSAQMRADARARCAGLDNVAVDDARLPDLGPETEARPVDLVTMVAALHHVDVDETLAEVARLLSRRSAPRRRPRALGHAPRLPVGRGSRR